MRKDDEALAPSRSLWFEGPLTTDSTVSGGGDEPVEGMAAWARTATGEIERSPSPIQEEPL